MAKLTEQLIDQVRNQADIVEVIGHYLPLTKKGRHYAAVCPFHDDHDPSLSISTDKQIYKCFVCNAGGNVFTYVQNYEHVSFVEAVAKVAQICHVDVHIDTSLTTRAIAPEFVLLHKILNETISFSSYQLTSVDGKEALSYLHGRDIDDAMIEMFQLGYIPKGGTKLHAFLSAKGYSDEDMIRSGVCRLGPSGMTDIFEGRILFPIHDMDGNPIAFSARILPQDQSEAKPKYINSNQTELYVKSAVLYNGHRAKQHCRQNKQVIVVEGPLDVIALHRVQVFHAVATMGTAFTKEQAQQLGKMAPDVVLCYDGDSAGQNASYKAGLICREMRIGLQVVRNALQLDPDEIIKKHGKDELKVMLETPQSWVDFLFTYFSTKFNLRNYSENKEFAMELMKEIALIMDTFDANVHKERLSQLTGFTSAQLDQLKPHIPVFKSNRTGKTIGVTKWSKIEIAQRMILSQMLHFKEAIELFEQELGFLIHEDMKYFALLLVSYYRRHGMVDFAGLLDELVDDERMRNLLFEIESYEWLEKTWNESALRDAFATIIEHDYDTRIEALKMEASRIADPRQKATILNSVIQLRNKKKGAMQ